MTAVGRLWLVRRSMQRGVAMLDPHAALIYTMVIVSAADANMADSELQAIA